MKFLSLLAVLALSVSAHAEQQGTVLKDRVNVRGKPGTSAEVLTQVNKGDKLTVLDRKTVAEGGKSVEWVRVTLPATAKCYVISKYLGDGVATGDNVNIRSGAGTNFQEVGKLAKGEKVEVIKQEGEWTQIKPTGKCSGWIAGDLLQVEDVIPPAVDTAPVIVPSSNAGTQPVPVALDPAPVAPAVKVSVRELDADPTVIVRYVVKDGYVGAVSGSDSAPASFELLTPEANRLQHRICYLESPQKNLTRYVGKRVRIAGNETWRKGERYPVVAIERIDIVW
jgi:uncharacterized protein YgiM (DUF1202 family)